MMMDQWRVLSAVPGQSSMPSVSTSNTNNAHFSRSTWKPPDASRCLRRAGVETLVHISGIGADAGSTSPYIRSRGRGEAAVLDAFSSARLIRPAVMFGPGDAFLRPLLTMLRHMPVFPMFGSGETRLQPAYVEDVAEAIVRVLRAPAARQLYELAGPRVYTYQELLRTIAASAGTRPFLVRFPFSLWHVIGFVSETLPRPPITRNQVELMEKDNIPEPDAPGFEALQISPQAIENILPQMMQVAREKGKHEPIPEPNLGKGGR